MQNAPETLNPITALMQLGTAIGAIDSFIASLQLEGSGHGHYFRRDKADSQTILKARDVIYCRNSLGISYDLWQSDVRRRLLRSQGNFYIFSMTAEETLGFTRRVVPGLTFSADHLNTLSQDWDKAEPLRNLCRIVEKTAENARLYALENKSALKVALDMLATDSKHPDSLPCLAEGAVQPIPLPRLPDAA
jgi:hypothetical protein